MQSLLTCSACHFVTFCAGKLKVGAAVVYGQETNIFQGGEEQKVRGGNITSEKLHVQ